MVISWLAPLTGLPLPRVARALFPGTDLPTPRLPCCAGLGVKARASAPSLHTWESGAGLCPRPLGPWGGPVCLHVTPRPGCLPHARSESCPAARWGSSRPCPPYQAVGAGEQPPFLPDAACPAWAWPSTARLWNEWRGSPPTLGLCLCGGLGGPARGCWRGSWDSSRTWGSRQGVWPGGSCLWPPWGRGAGGAHKERGLEGWALGPPRMVACAPRRCRGRTGRGRRRVGLAGRGRGAPAGAGQGLVRAWLRLVGAPGERGTRSLSPYEKEKSHGGGARSRGGWAVTRPLSHSFIQQTLGHGMKRTKVPAPSELGSR